MVEPTSNSLDPAEAPIPLGLRLGIAMASLLITGCMGEGLTRWLGDGARPHLNIFHQTDDNQITLAPDAESRVRRITGEVFTVTTNADGLRMPAPDGPAWLVVGDSQVLGMGVAGEETFAAIAGLYNGGVPGYGVADALDAAAALVPALDAEGVLVIINQANDWTEGLVPIRQRHVVAQGWLLESAEGAASGFWSSPLSRSHLLYYAGLLLTIGGPQALAADDGAVPDWLRDPAGQAALTAQLGESVRAFAAAQPELPVVVGFLPVDLVAGPDRVAQSAFGQYAEGLSSPPWSDTHLREQLQAATAPLPFLDLTPALAGHPEAFLDRDYHLSAAGHALVAAAITENIH